MVWWVLRWVLFFFSSRRRHTRYWRDWSSDVCSSDLLDLDAGVAGPHAPCGAAGAGGLGQVLLGAGLPAHGLDEALDEIGSASCRGRVQTSVVLAPLKKKNMQCS